MYHFDGARDEEVIPRIIGFGPGATTPLRPDEGRFGRRAEYRGHAPPPTSRGRRQDGGIAWTRFFHPSPRRLQ